MSKILDLIMGQPNISKTSIMFTDIVGYSAMVGKDENKALSLLDEHNNIIFPIIKSNKGEIIKLIGDAIFARFPSSSCSINAATKIQEKLGERNSVSQKDNKIQIRIGLHEGKVIEKDNDLFGHDVNLCSRIESLAPSGGIAVSARLIDNVGGSNDLYYREMGYIKLKNIIEPQQIYKLYHNANEYDSETDKQLQEYLKNHGIEIIDINSYNIEETFSIAISYVTNLGVKTDESLAYSMTEDLINDLGYINSMRTPGFNEVIKYKNTDIHNDDIARKLQVNNILQGSLLKENKNIKLNFQLISTDLGQVLWEDTWTDNASNSKSIRKHILDAILSQFKLDFPKQLINYFSEEMSDNPEAIEMYNSGKYCMDCIEDKDDIEKAKNYFAKAIEIDRGFVEAYYMLSMSNKRLGYFEDAEIALNNGEEIAEEQSNIHGTSYIYRGYKNLYTSWGKYDKAKLYIVKALKAHLKLSHPTFETFLRLDYANCLNNLFQTDLSIEQSNLAIELLKKMENTRHLGIAYGNLSDTYLIQGDYTKSIENGTKGLAIFRKEQISNNTAIMLLWLADSYYRTGMYKEMNICILEAEEILSGLDDNFRQGKISFFKAQYSRQKNDYPSALKLIENSIESYNLSQNTTFEISALIEKLNLLVESENLSQTDSTISKIDLLTKQVSYSSDNYDAIKIYIAAKKGESNKKLIDTLNLDSDKEKDHLNSNNNFLAYWYIAKTYHLHNELSLSTDYHENAKLIIATQSEKISGKAERKSYLNSIITKLVKEEIESEPTKIDKPETEISVFAFCPSCGFKNEDNFSFCPSCGNNLKQ